MGTPAADPPPDGLAVVDKPAGWTSHDVVAKARGVLAHPQDRPLGHPRPRRHRRAAPRRRPGHPPAALPHRPAEGTTSARSCSASRPPRSTPPARSWPPTTWTSVTLDEARSGGRHALTGRHHAGAADGLGDQGRRPAAARAGPGGDRGRAGAATRHRAPLRRRAVPDRPGRATGPRSTARRAPTCASLAADLGHALGGGRAPARPAPHRDRLVSPWPRPIPSTICRCCRSKQAVRDWPV